MARLIRPDGTEEIVVPEKGKKFTLEELQKHVGGFITLMPRCGKRQILVDEEGMFPKMLPQNKVATRWMIDEGLPCYSPIVGNALILDASEKM